MSYMEPVELLRTVLVSKQWYNNVLSHMASLTSLHLYPFYIAINSGDFKGSFIAILLMTQDNVQKLNFSGIKELKLDNAYCKAIADLCPNLVELDISDLRIDREVAEGFSKHLPLNLTCLVLKKCKSLGDRNLEKILINARNLERLIIAYNWDITGKSFLQHLRQNKISHFTYRFCQEFEERFLQSLLMHNIKTLQYLDLYGSESRDLGILTNEITPLVNMRTFYTPDWQHAGIELVKLLTLFPNLETLVLSHLKWIPSLETFFAEVVKSCPKIKSLTIPGAPIRNQDELYSIRYLGNLQQFLSEDLCVNSSLDKFVEETLLKCRKLERLSLRGSSINDSMVILIISSLPSLISLDLRKCASVTGSFIEDCRGMWRKLPLRVYVSGTQMWDLEIGESTSIIIHQDLDFS